MKTKPLLLYLMTSFQVMACVFIEDLSLRITETATRITIITPPERIKTPKPSETLPYTSLPSPNQNDVCVLFPDGESIWLKEGTHPPKEIASPKYETSNAACPPETLLPRVEVNIADIGTPETYEMRNLIPHLCRQHPLRKEVWFNTERPQDYGEYYQSDLWWFNVENNSVEQILQDEQGGQFFSFSPDGEYLILAGSQNLRLMHSDGSELHQLFEFPLLSICSEVNVWVIPWWYPDSSGVILNTRPGCLNDPASWPFGLWWIPIEGETVSIDSFVPEIGSYNLMNPSPHRRPIDSERYVFLDKRTLYLSQDDRQPIELMTLEKPNEGYAAFLCPSSE